MEQQRIRRAVAARRPHQAIVDRLLRLVAEAQSRQQAVARHRVLVAGDGVRDVVEQRRNRFTDAGPIIAVAPAAGRARDQRRAHKALRIDHGLGADCTHP